MRSCALVVAGGAGERMRRSGSPTPKPLVAVGGRPLLEHCVLALLDAGIGEIHIAVAAHMPDVEDFARRRCGELAKRDGADLNVIVEATPLGSLGAVAAIPGPPDEVLVVNSDNVTSLDLNEVIASHRTSGAAMTIAVHEEPFAMPFGEISLDGVRVVAYREKPTYRIPVCSAVTVLGAEALRRVEPGENVGLPALANRLLDDGAAIHAFVHQAPWVDVNDLSAVPRAEELLRAAQDRVMEDRT